METRTQEITDIATMLAMAILGAWMFFVGTHVQMAVDNLTYLTKCEHVFGGNPDSQSCEDWLSGSVLGDA